VLRRSSGTPIVSGIPPTKKPEAGQLVVLESYFEHDESYFQHD
jgi:hypothetical protein